MTRGGSGKGHDRMSAEDTRDESFAEEQARSIDANNATYALGRSPARIETSFGDLLSLESDSRLLKDENLFFPRRAEPNFARPKATHVTFSLQRFFVPGANFTIRPGLRPGFAVRASCRTPTIDSRSSQNPPVRP